MCLIIYLIKDLKSDTWCRSARFGYFSADMNEASIFRSYKNAEVGIKLCMRNGVTLTSDAGSYLSDDIKDFHRKGDLIDLQIKEFRIEEK